MEKTFATSNYRLPREQFRTFNKMSWKEEMATEFRNDPVGFLKKNGVDTTNFTLSKDIKIPSLEEVLSRINQYFGENEFAKPAAFMDGSNPIFLVFLVFIIPGDTPKK